MFALIVWIFIGLGVWLGLVLPNWESYIKIDAEKMFLGFVLTLLLWPWSLVNNYDNGDRT